MRAIPLPKGVVPIGATHFFYNPQRSKRSTDVWRKREDGKWFMYMDDKQQWQQIGAKSAHMFVPIESTFEQDRQGREDLNAIYSAPVRKPYDDLEIKRTDVQRKAEFVPTTKPASSKIGLGWQGPGYGLPKAGDVIEFDRGGKDWVKVEVFAVENGIDESSDVLFRHSEGWGFIDSASERIRPYVSEEEKARRERSAYLGRMYLIVKSRSESQDAVEALYDAGLRFQEEA